MLLNGGSYGELQFMSPEALAGMMPRNIEPLIGKKTQTTWGIGTTWMTDEGLSDKAFGHGAASSAIFIVDPELDMVIVQTRARGGKLYQEYRKEFVRLLTSGVR
jgi:CubicO group peptidase (beta-lactamase class C family)